MNETIFDFFKSQKLEKIKGILVKDCNDCDNDKLLKYYNENDLDCLIIEICGAEQ